MKLYAPLTLTGLYLATCTAAADESACNALLDWADGPEDLAITAATYASDRSAGGGNPPAALPPHCHVVGSFEHRTGSDGRDYAIRFAINLPDDWNGRLLFQGGGGLNGTLQEPVGAQSAGPASALAQGFAVVSTDSGHVGAVFDASFMADQQAMLNFQYQANAKVTDVARPIIDGYYGASVAHSYFVGCSTGGREGMIMAQRYPHLFDGIVSGAPAMRTAVSNLALRWINAELDTVTDPQDPFTSDEEGLVMAALMDRCDALDGHADGLIFHRSACGFDPRELACSASSNSASSTGAPSPGQTCLADDKAEALARALRGPVTAAGTPVYVPFPYDTGLDDAAGIPGLLLAGGSPPEGASGAGAQGQNVDEEYLAATSGGEVLGHTATQYNVSTFIVNGGKHLFYHGESDPWFSANDTVRYFEQMADANAAVKPVDEYARLYLVPGMAHCAGGARTVDAFDLLTPLVEWVEAGEAPGAVIATGQSMPGESRPLCAWPAYAHFDGGDPAAAGSYVCRAP